MHRLSAISHGCLQSRLLPSMLLLLLKSQLAEETEATIGTVLCFVKLQTSLRSRYTPPYRPNPSPGQRPHRLACVDSCNQAGAAEALCVLRFALPRFRPRYVAVTYLVADPSPAWASDPPFCHHLASGSCKFLTGAAEACFAYCACTEELRMSSRSCCSSLFCATLCY